MYANGGVADIVLTRSHWPSSIATVPTYQYQFSPQLPIGHTDRVHEFVADVHAHGRVRPRENAVARELLHDVVIQPRIPLVVVRGDGDGLGAVAVRVVEVELHPRGGVGRAAVRVGDVVVGVPTARQRPHMRVQVPRLRVPREHDPRDVHARLGHELEVHVARLALVEVDRCRHVDVSVRGRLRRDAGLGRHIVDAVAAEAACEGGLRAHRHGRALDSQAGHRVKDRALDVAGVVLLFGDGDEVAARRQQHDRSRHGHDCADTREVEHRDLPAGRAGTC